jgi:glycosyltransferase involved in cell wall biosynthesis
VSVEKRAQVVFVTPWYPHPAHPASGVFIREHAIAASLFDDVAVVHLAGREEQGAFRIDVEELPDEPLPTVRAWYRDGRRGGVIRQIGSIHKALSYLRAKRGIDADVIHAHTASAVFPAAAYTRALGIPLVITEHWSIYLDEDPASLPSVARTLTRWGLHQARVILPVGSALERAMRRVAPRGRYVVIPNVVDTDLFHPGDSLPRTSEPRLLAVGLLSPEKCYDVLLASIRLLVDEGLSLQLEIAGYGSEKAKITSLISQLELDNHVTLLGFLSKAALAERMRSADLFVHASAFETFGVSVAEAMASGLPVVCTRCGGPEDYVTPAVGCLVPPRDVPALAMGIREMLAHLDDFDRHVISSIARSRFSTVAVGRQLHSVYGQLQ